MILFDDGGTMNRIGDDDISIQNHFLTDDFGFSQFFIYGSAEII
jgi:hypothetical protein